MAKHVKHIEAWYKYFETFEHERNNEKDTDDKEILMVPYCLAFSGVPAVPDFQGKSTLPYRSRGI